MIRIVIADDHPIVREGLRSLIRYQTDMTLVGEADDGAHLLPLLATLAPDVVLIDLRMPRLGGLDLLRRIQEQSPAPACLVLSSYDEPAYVMAAIEAGARGYLLKHSAHAMILDAIRSVARGEHIEISPEDARKEGLKPGDIVQLYNDYGEATAYTVVSTSVKPGMIFMLFAHPRSTANSLTTPYVDPEVIIPYYKGSAVGLRKLGRLEDLDARLTYHPTNFETVA